jgi:hypothetical protein
MPSGLPRLQRLYRLVCLVPRHSPPSRPEKKAWSSALDLEHIVADSNSFVSSFVSCPIALYPAISAADRVSFRQVKGAPATASHKLVDSVTGEAVDTSDKARGYE